MTQFTKPEAVMIRAFRALKQVSRFTTAQDDSTLDRSRAALHTATRAGTESVLYDSKRIVLDMKKAEDVVTWTELHKLFLRNLTGRTGDYKLLWEWYVENSGQNPKTTVLWAQAIASWQGYCEENMAAVQEADLLHGRDTTSKYVLALSRGPSKWLEKGDRVKLGAMELCTERLEMTKKSCDSVVMIKLASASGKDDAEFGRAQAFYRLVLPGKPEESLWAIEDSMLLADVCWFKRPGAGQHTNVAIRCPVVTRGYRNDQTGNYWELGSLVPTKVGLAPHHQNASWWQVLHADSDFMSRNYWC